MADSRAEERKFKLSLEHLVPENMEVLKKKQKNGVLSKKHRNQPDRIHYELS